MIHFFFSLVCDESYVFHFPLLTRTFAAGLERSQDGIYLIVFCLFDLLDTMWVLFQVSIPC